MDSLTDINIQVDNSILFSLRQSKDEFVQNLLFNHSKNLYRTSKLSLGKAAELAGLSRIDFILKLQSEGESIFDYDEVMVNDLINKSSKVLELLGEISFKKALCPIK